jgi:hypothetical protein
MMNEAIIEKIQKLLSLANSDNENEAKSATKRANEMLLKYNLNMQQIKDIQFEYVTQDALSVGLTLKAYQIQISSLLTNFFFVRVIISKERVGRSSGNNSWYRSSRTQWKKTIKMIGTKENCQIASYIFEYLNGAYPKLWKEYKSKNSWAGKAHQKSYFTGLSAGINEMLKAQKWQVEQEMGLVVVSDPALDKYVSERAKGTYAQKSSDVDARVFADGVRDGAKVTLRKPLDSTSVDSGKLLEKK